uniref:Uncharacterized protein n=1 Tax=Caenorhabditis japonica TaxID=281687 RepID=A0A8R1E6Q0_CAEJA
MTTMSLIGEERARMERVAVNFTIQGSASEIFKTAIVDIEDKIKSKRKNFQGDLNPHNFRPLFSQNHAHNSRRSARRIANLPRGSRLKNHSRIYGELIVTLIAGSDACIAENGF